MASVRSWKILCLCGVLAGSALAQKTSPAPAKAPAKTQTEVSTKDVSSKTGAAKPEMRPAIFQPGPTELQVSATPGMAQLSTANFHLASNEEVDGMEQTLEQYVTAFERLSLAEVKQVWPELDQKHSKAFKDVFAAFRQMAAPPRLGLTCAIPKVSEGLANVDCLETVTYEVSKGKTKEAGPAKVSIQLKGESRRWVVQDMKGAG